MLINNQSIILWFLILFYKFYEKNSNYVSLVNMIMLNINIIRNFCGNQNLKMSNMFIEQFAQATLFCQCRGLSVPKTMIFINSSHKTWVWLKVL